MADVKDRNGEVPADDPSAFIEATPFWVIWQVRLPADGRNRIRRISQDYPTLARAEEEAEHYRRSGAVTWVEEARPLAPRDVPAEALVALRGQAPGEGVTAIGGRIASSVAEPG